MRDDSLPSWSLVMPFGKLQLPRNGSKTLGSWSFLEQFPSSSLGTRYAPTCRTRGLSPLLAWRSLETSGSWSFLERFPSSSLGTRQGSASSLIPHPSSFIPHPFPTHRHFGPEVPERCLALMDRFRHFHKAPEES